MKTTYLLWVKVNETETKSWHSPDLLNFQKFLDMKYPDWRFYNVYQNDKQIASFTKNRRSTSKKVIQ